jgi:hypothetical protein
VVAALTACRRILKLVHAVRERVERQRTRDGAIIDLLLDKAETTARAVLLLGTRGYAEDALVLARSLAGLAIDVAYLGAKDADRFRSYRATGREARKRMAEQCGFQAPDASAKDWEDAAPGHDAW